MNTASAACILLETCAPWPVGVHPVAAVGDEVQLLRAVERIDRRSFPRALPRTIEPFGLLERGAAVIECGVTCEAFGDGVFVRAWLDVVRAAFPGIQWRLGRPLADESVPVAYACVAGRIVAAVCSLRFPNEARS